MAECLRDLGEPGHVGSHRAAAACGLAAPAASWGLAVRAPLMPARPRSLPHPRAVDFAARALVARGRLVFFVPAAPGYYFEAELPTHPALAMVANCEQLLSRKYSRRLVVMEKVAPYDAAAASAHYARLGPPRCDHIRAWGAAMALEPMARVPQRAHPPRSYCSAPACCTQDDDRLDACLCLQQD